jgi:hypothetical protein
MRSKYYFSHDLLSSVCAWFLEIFSYPGLYSHYHLPKKYKEILISPKFFFLWAERSWHKFHIWLSLYLSQLKWTQMKWSLSDSCASDQRWYILLADRRRWHLVTMGSPGDLPVGICAEVPGSGRHCCCYSDVDCQLSGYSPPVVDRSTYQTSYKTTDSSKSWLRLFSIWYLLSFKWTISYRLLSPYNKKEMTFRYMYWYTSIMVFSAVFQIWQNLAGRANLQKLQSQNIYMYVHSIFMIFSQTCATHKWKFYKKKSCLTSEIMSKLNNKALNFHLLHFLCF